MLQHVFEQASISRYVSSMMVATGGETWTKFGAPVRITRAEHVSGAGRVAGAASAENADLIVNIQENESPIDPGAIDSAPGELDDPNVGKVLPDKYGNALYLARLFEATTVNTGPYA